MRRKRQFKKKEDALFRLRATMRWRLMLFTVSIILVSAVLTAVLSIALFLLFDKLPFVVAMRLNPYIFILILLCTCAVLSAPLSVLFGKYYLAPIKSLIAATKEVKKGNFDVRVKVGSDPEDPTTEMDLLIVNFNEMARELGGIELFRNDFINNFSHEFKTPIVSIRGFAKELQLGDLDEEQRREYAKIIAEEADRLAKLSTSVLELSKLENQQIITDRTELWLDEQIRQSILLQESAWSQKEIDMIPELEPIKYRGNAELLNHVWRNLVSNAIKFTPEGGIVTVRLTEDERCVIFSVSDTGIGMSEETQAHIFEKFYQGDRSHARAGYGIGLTVVGRVVALCGGEIRVESVLGEGSTFTVSLPKE